MLHIFHHKYHHVYTIDVTHRSTNATALPLAAHISIHILWSVFFGAYKYHPFISDHITNIQHNVYDISHVYNVFYTSLRNYYILLCVIWKSSFHINIILSHLITSDVHNEIDTSDIYNTFYISHVCNVFYTPLRNYYRLAHCRFHGFQKCVCVCERESMHVCSCVTICALKSVTQVSW